MTSTASTRITDNPRQSAHWNQTPHATTDVLTGVRQGPDATLAGGGVFQILSQEGEKVVC